MSYTPAITIFEGPRFDLERSFRAESGFDNYDFFFGKCFSSSVSPICHGKVVLSRAIQFIYITRRNAIFEKFHGTCSSSFASAWSFSHMLLGWSVDVILPYTTPFDIILTVFFKACLLLQNQILITSLSYPSLCAKVVISLPVKKKKDLNVFNSVKESTGLKKNKLLARDFMMQYKLII